MVYQKVLKQSTRKDPVFKTKERESKRSARRNPVFRAKETVYQKESKQSARKDPVFKTKERESKQSARKDPVFKGNEIVYQKKSKQRARENPYVLECERIKKQQIRMEKRKINDDLEITNPRKKIKHDIDLLPKKDSRKTLKLLKSVSNDFIQIYLLDPYMCVHVAIRHGSGKLFQC